MKLRTLLPVLVVLFIACLPSVAQAMRPAARTIQSVPFDGGLSLLVAAGVGYAAKKGYNKRKNNTADADME